MEDATVHPPPTERISKKQRGKEVFKRMASRKERFVAKRHKPPETKFVEEKRSKVDRAAKADVNPSLKNDLLGAAAGEYRNSLRFVNRLMDSELALSAERTSGTATESTRGDYQKLDGDINQLLEEARYASAQDKTLLLKQIDDLSAKKRGVLDSIIGAGAIPPHDELLESRLLDSLRVRGSRVKKERVSQEIQNDAVVNQLTIRQRSAVDEYSDILDRKPLVEDSLPVEESSIHEVKSTIEKTRKEIKETDSVVDKAILTGQLSEAVTQKGEILHNHHKSEKKKLAVSAKELDTAGREYRNKIKREVTPEAENRATVEEEYVAKITDLNDNIDKKMQFYNGTNTMWLQDYDRQGIAITLLLEQLTNTALTDKERIEITKRLRMHVSDKQYIFNKYYGSAKPARRIE